MKRAATPSPGFGVDREIVIRVRAAVESLGLVTPEYTIVATTRKTRPTINWDQLERQYKTVKTLIEHFGSRAADLFTAVKNDADGVAEALKTGVSAGLNEYFTNWKTNIQSAFFSWLGNGLSSLSAVNIDSADSVTSFLLEYSGLTWKHVQDVLLEELGEGNLAAIESIAEKFGSVNPSDPMSVLNFLKTSFTAEDDLNFTAEVETTVVAGIKTQIGNAMVAAGAQLAAKFIPGAGAANLIYQMLTWVVDNRTRMQGLLDEFVAGIDSLIQKDATGIKNHLVAGLQSAGTTMISFFAAQLGLAKLPAEIKNMMSAIPTKIDAALRKMVHRLIPAAPTTQKDVFKNRLEGKPLVPFEYQNKTYAMWVAAEKTGPKLRIAEKNGSSYTVVGDLTDKSFEDRTGL